MRHAERITDRYVDVEHHYIPSSAHREAVPAVQMYVDI